MTGSAGLADGWVPVALVAFCVGSFLGVTIAGRLCDRWPGPVLAVGGPMLLLGWVALALLASRPGLLLALVLVQGVLSFAAVMALSRARRDGSATTAPPAGGSRRRASRARG